MILFPYEAAGGRRVAGPCSVEMIYQWTFHSSYSCSYSRCPAYLSFEIVLFVSLIVAMQSNASRSIVFASADSLTDGYLAFPFASLQVGYSCNGGPCAFDAISSTELSFSLILLFCRFLKRFQRG
jgi:hypothetical protein